MKLNHKNINILAFGSTIAASLLFSYILKPLPSFGDIDEEQDLGHLDLPRKRFDVNGDGKDDFCRFVGNKPKIFITCNVTNDNQYSYRSIEGINPGYSTMYREFIDKNSDGYGDYCRCVGDYPNIILSCNLGQKTGFNTNQYTQQFLGYECKP